MNRYDVIPMRIVYRKYHIRQRARGLAIIARLMHKSQHCHSYLASKTANQSELSAVECGGGVGKPAIMSQLTLCLLLLGGLACLSPAVSGQVCPTEAPDTYVFEPSTLSDSVHTVATEDPQLARRPALCHVVCINRIILATSGNGTNGTATDEDPWMPVCHKLSSLVLCE